MTAILRGTVGADLTREAWLEARKSGIGGSDAPAIAGAVEWASPMSIYLDKLGLVENDLSDNEAVFWGSRLEGTVTDRVAEVTGHPVTRRQAFLAHPDYPWMLATVDGITTNDAGDEGLVEVKTTGAWRAKTWASGVPLHVFVQVQHDLAATGLPWARVGVLIGGQKFELHHVARDDSYISQLIDLERDFVENHLIPQVPPAIDGSKASEDALRILFPADDGTELTTDDPAIEMAARKYLDYKAECARAEKEKRAAANELRALIGAHECATIGGKYRATWKTIERDAYEVKASSYRKLDVREMGGGGQ